MTQEKLTQIISELDEQQQLKLIEYLEYQLFPDQEEEDIRQKKNGVYNKYSTIISSLIAKVEVYAHDLPRQISGLIEMTFRILSSASDVVQRDNELLLYDKAIVYEHFLKNILEFFLIELYMKEIKHYKKIFKKFKYKGIKESDGTPVMEVINAQLKEIQRLKKESIKKFRKAYRMSYFEFMFFIDKFPFWEKFTSLKVDVDIHTNTDFQELQDAFNIAEKSVAFCEEYYPSIIGNGYDSTLIRRILYSMPTAISVVLALVGAIIIIRKVVGIG